MRDVFDRFLNEQEQLRKQFESLFTSIRPAMESIEQSQRAASKIIEGIGFPFPSGFTEAARKYAEIQKQYDSLFSSVIKTTKQIGTLHDKYMLILVEIGWVPVLDATIDLVQKIVESYEQEGVENTKDFVDALFVEFYNAEILEEKLLEWAKHHYLTRRIPILRSAINSHNSGDYWSSIPTILPQIEGLVAEAKNHSGFLGGAKYREYLSELTSDRGTLSEVIGEFIKNELLSGFGHGQQIVAELSRHAILHGGDVDYGTATNSLKAILLFDFIQDCMNE